MLAAIISALANAAQVLLDKVIVGEKNMNGLSLLKIEMFFIAIWMFIPSILWGSFGPEFFTAKYILLLSVMILVGLAGNYLYFLALENKSVCELEPIVLLGTPLTIVFAMIIFPSERSFILLLISAVATLALLLSRVEKRHLDFDKFSWLLLLSCVFGATESILVKYMLEATNAVSLYGVRTALIALVFFLFFRKIKLTKMNTTETVQSFTNGGITSISFVAKFFAIASIGVVKSSLIMLLGPIIILVVSKLFFNERITPKRAWGDAVIVFCIAALSIVGK